MKEIIGYHCQHCGKIEGAHKAKTKECPLKGRSSFAGYGTTKYEPNLKKPIHGQTL